MDYVKGPLQSYKRQIGSPALMETSVNQAWPQSTTTTGRINPMTSPSATPLPLQDVPQEQLPSSSTLSPAPIFTQPRKALTPIHDPELHQQQSRKKLRIQPSVTLDQDSKMQVKSENGIPVNRADGGYDLETRTRLEKLHIMASGDSTPDLPSSQTPLVPPKTAIKSITPKIHIVNRKDAGTQGTLGINIQEIFKIFRSVIDGAFNNLEFEIPQQNFYEICSVACSTTPSKDIFTVVSDVLHDNIAKIGRKMEALASEKVNFLSLLVLGWRQCLTVLVKINELFNPLNSKYIIKETKYPSLFHFGKEIYVNMLSESSKIKTRTIISLTHLISCQRHQIDIGLTIITSALHIIHENLPIYAAEFGQELMQSTRKFYQKCASAGLKTLTMENYVTYALRLIVCEPTAIYYYRQYIPENIESPSRIALKELLSKHPRHIENCFELAVEQGQEQLLKALYQLFTHHGGISILQTAFEHYILDECNAICSDYRINNKGNAADDQRQYRLFVSGFLELKSRLHSILDRCFDSNEEFHHSLRKCFEESINRDQSASAQHIAGYMNHLLESASVFSSSTHSSTLKTLDRCIDLFKNLQAEDVFKRYYKAYLTRRLLMYRNQTALTKEMDMTDRLESECGVDFAKDLFGMINEVRISQLRMTKFEEVTSSFRDENSMQLNVNVLSGENWALNIRKEELRLSSQMLTQQQYYNEFYLLENPRSKLTWMASLSTCVVNASYPDCTIQLHTTQYQAMILLLFNNPKATFYTVEFISQRTGINESDVMKSLKTLASPELPLLTRRHHSSMEMAPTITQSDKTVWQQDDVDVFEYNQLFYSTDTEVTLPNLLSELPSTSVKVMYKQELFNKKELLQASIMRILKKHKSLEIVDIWEQVKNGAKSGRRKLMIRLSLVENELQELVRRCLIRNTKDDVYEYREE